MRHTIVSTPKAIDVIPATEVNKVAVEAGAPGYRDNCCDGMFTLNRFGNGLLRGRGKHKCNL
jgi:hypothetical protein